MSREVPEWRGKTDDTPIPPRVRARLYLMGNGKCCKCTRFIDGKKLTAEYDHIVPLILGGSNSEVNLQLLCKPCHQAKTKLDVKLKAKVARVRKRNIGIKKPRTIRSWRKFNGEIVFAPRARS